MTDANIERIRRVYAADQRPDYIEYVPQSNRDVHALLAALDEATARALKAEAELAGLRERQRVDAFELVERELREADVNTVRVMYWDKGASDTLMACNDEHCVCGTLLEAIDALKKKETT